MPCSTCTVFSQGAWLSCGLCSPSEAFLAGQGTQSGSDSPQDPGVARASRALNDLPSPERVRCHLIAKALCIFCVGPAWCAVQPFPSLDFRPPCISGPLQPDRHHPINKRDGGRAGQLWARPWRRRITLSRPQR